MAKNKNNGQAAQALLRDRNLRTWLIAKGLLVPKQQAPVLELDATAQKAGVGWHPADHGLAEPMVHGSRWDMPDPEAFFNDS